uniref:TraB/GumN family protein n=1 Tax=Prevotella heparinolytica TaxID=28113 RepID=UPI0035A148A2
MKKIISLLLLICLVQSAHAQLLWKISGNGLEKPSYVFGTYHLSPLGIKDSIAALPQAVNETTQVYGEVVMSEMMSPAFMQSMQQQMMMPKDSTLQSLFTPEQYEEVGKVIKENMMVDIAMLAQLKPAAITQQLAVILYMRHTPGFNPQEQLDNYFQQQAQQQGKKVGGLETVQSQIDILFNSQTLKRQAELLHCMAHDIDRTVGQVKRVIAAYQKQDLNIVQQLLAERRGDACDPLPGM